MMKKITNIKEGVKINFIGEVKKENIVKMVDNCSTGSCSCMNDDTKSKIKNIKVDGKDGDVELSLEGNISVKEIQDAVSKSKVLN